MRRKIEIDRQIIRELGRYLKRLNLRYIDSKNRQRQIDK